jgi:hypothetical protein
MRKREAPDAWRKSRTSLGTGSLSGRFIESLFRFKNPNQSLLMAQQLRQLGDVDGDAPGFVAWGNASRFRNRSIRNSPVMEQCCVLRDFNMNRFLPLISCVLVGILVSSCARNPPRVVPEPPTDQPIGRPNTIMSPLRKCHFAIRERRVRGTVDCSVPGTTLRLRMPRRPGT